MDQTSLFDSFDVSEPLASRLRPDSLDNYYGQEHLLGKGKILRRMIEQDKVASMILWGPPGVGKTTLARIIAKKTKSRFVDFSAATSSIKDIKVEMTSAK
ncbi:MAG: AAA family ATPase, partial [Clostridiales bacterium]|nr:AAA family ATPase [Clostridiales bacterium]